MNIAFFAPMKSPCHPVPSGDRLMARQLMKALEVGGAHVRLASKLRIYAREPSEAWLGEVKAAAAAEADRLIAAWTSECWLPDIWFSYHTYYKAPDFIGPAIASHFGVPMVTVEASYAKRRATRAWSAWHAANLACLRAARCHFTMTARDRRGLAQMPGQAAELYDLPPFIDTTDFTGDFVENFIAAQGGHTVSDPVRLITVAMMRADVKRKSYMFLSRALAEISDLNWTLDIVGDGPARSEIEHAFADLPAGRVTWHGKLERSSIVELFGRGDMFVWPGIDEAYGLAFLEAQAMALPVVALDNAGVPEVVRHNVTGLLVRRADTQAYAAALRCYIEAPILRATHGRQARAFVMNERSLDQARQRIFRILEKIVYT